MDNGLRRVVVAGGSGFIGRAYCRALLARGYQVTVLTRGPARGASITPEGPVPEFVTWDGRTAKGWGHLAEGALALVSLAGESIAEGRWTQERKRTILESRVHAGLAMRQAVSGASAKPGMLLQASAVGFYGDTGEDAVDESAPPGTGFLSDVCLQVEASTRPVEDMGVRRVVIRTGVVLGLGGGVLEKMIPAYRAFLGGPFGDGRQGFPWIHLDDEVRAMVFLLEHATASGPFNLCAPEAVSNREFCRALAKVLGRLCGMAVPAAMLRLAFGEMASELLLSGCRAFPRRLVELGFVFDHPRLDEALKSLIPGP